MKKTLIVVCCLVAAFLALGFIVGHEQGCIAEVSPRLRATHADYAQRAVDVCRAASMGFDRRSENGLIEPGNIDLHHRPVVHNADGSISTVRSMTFTENDGSTVLLPTVIAGRGIVSPEEAFLYYKQTNQHLGRFDSVENADAYARALHEQQAAEYVR